MKLNILLASFCLAASLLHAQSDAGTPSRVEFTVNPLMLAYLSPNLGLRVDTKGNWDPEFYVATQLPVLGKVDVYYPTAMPFTNLHGYGLTAYAGLSKSRNGFGNRGFRLTLQLGMKVYDTGVYKFRAGDATGQSCGIESHTRITAGPRVIASYRFKPGKHVGLEMYAGGGVRVGINRYAYFMEGEMQNLTNCRPVPDFQPYLKQTLSVPITLHMGFNVVLH